MKRVLLILFFLPILGFGQVIPAGTYKIGSGEPSPYTSLANVIARVNTSGISGPVTFLLKASETLSSTLIISSSTITSVNTLTIKPDAGQNVTISGNMGNSSTSAIIKIDGTDYVTIDGSNNNTDSRNLTFSNISTVNYANFGEVHSAILWIANKTNSDAALYNTIKNVNFVGSSVDVTSSTSAGIVISGGANMQTVESISNSNTKISNNSFSKMKFGIWTLGGNSLNQNLIVENNIFGLPADTNNVIVYNAIKLSNAANALISNNTIYGVTYLSNGTSTTSAIYLYNTSSNTKILANKINNITSNGAASGIYVDLNVISNSGLIIANNFIRDIKTNNNSNDINNSSAGIFLKNVKDISIYYNTVHLNSTQTGLSSALFVSDNPTLLNIRNNSFTNTNSGGFKYAVYSTTSNSAFTDINYNNYSAANIGFLSGNQTTLANWKTATGKDVNSINLLPTFLSSTDLHLQEVAANSALKAGAVISAIATDVDGNIRSASTPYIGADEIACVATETPGNNYWKGYVYTYTGTPAATTYVGTVAEKTNFDRDVVAGTITGDTSVAADNFCGTAPSDKFFVRYLMNVTLAEAGNYNITVGGDDGYRLYIDNVLVTALNNWADHGYTSTFAKQALTAGNHQFKLEYYENGASSRVSFAYGLPKGDPILPFGDNVWNVYAFSKANLDFANTELRDSYAGYYIDPAINFSSQTFWNKGQSPSVNNSAWNGAPIQIDNFTLTYKRKGFPCGRYQIQLVNCDDVAQVYLNGTLIFSQTYTINGGIINNNAFYTLNKDSEIEVRLREDGGDANVAFNFIEVPFVYDGSTAPPAGSSITVNQDSNVANNLDVCSCYITAGKTLTVPANVTLTVRENIDIKTNGKLVVKNNGSLLQDNTGVFTGAATSFVMERTSSPMKNFDYTYWSSPVAGQTLYNLSPNTLSDKYFSYGDTGWKQEVASTTTMGAGIGYIIRTPKEGLWGNGENVVFPYAQPVKFIGKPNNGNIVSAQNMTAGKYYLVGNPYPSAMDADAFLFTNVNNRAILKGTIYFWTHNTGITQSGSKYVYASNDYASYNLTGGTSTSASSPGNKSIPQGYIAAGQSFFAIAETSGNVQFNNSMRPVGNNSQFFKPVKTSKSGELEKNRLWLNMTNSGGAFKQTLVGYIEGASNDFDLDFDGFSFDGNSFIDFYSVNETGNLTIQGRSLPFVESDAVPLGYRTTVEGDFTISINNVDGVLADQRVYLEDKQTNVISELTAKDYTFTTKTGVFNNRFVLRYTNKTLGTGDFETVQDAVSVVVKNKEVSVNSTGENIDKVYVYDISGKQLYKKENVANTQLIIQNLSASQQVLLVKTFLENGTNITKKVIFH